MKRGIVIALASIALVGSVAPAAVGQDYGYEDRGDRRPDHREVRRDYGRDDYDDDRCHEERYVVHFHLEGGDGEVRATSHRRAHRIAAFLRSVGADAHVDGHRTVHFEMHGEAEIVRYSHADAHRLAQKLEGYGFSAHVDPE